ncbi:MAG: hypothetical protein [Bacteriophage sp.]|nr:MAG: hypothetical protein [Bacteriophage sp.]
MVTLLKVLASAIYAHFRRNATIHEIMNHRVFKQTFKVCQTNTNYQVTVEECLYIVDYKRWWIPKLKRQLYKATLEQLHVDEALNRRVIGYYPLLTYDGIYDPLYPLSIVASKHIETHINSEITHEDGE